MTNFQILLEVLLAVLVGLILLAKPWNKAPGFKFYGSAILCGILIWGLIITPFTSIG